MSKETLSTLLERACAAIAAEPVLQAIPVAIARADASAAAHMALACLLSGGWGRLALRGRA